MLDRPGRTGHEARAVTSDGSAARLACHAVPISRLEYCFFIDATVVVCCCACTYRGIGRSENRGRGQGLVALGRRDSRDGRSVREYFPKGKVGKAVGQDQAGRQLAT